MEDLPPRPRRFTRRLLVFLARALITLIIIAILLGLLYLRSGRFNRFIAIEIEKALEAYGLRAEIGSFEIVGGLRAVTLRDVKLFNLRTDQIIATIDRATVSITIRDPFALRLRREIVLDHLDLEGVDLWVVFNERGQSNFQGLRRPPPLGRRITFDYSRLVGSLSRGALHFIDQKRDIRSYLGDLNGEARPVEGASPPRVYARLASGAGHLSRNDHDMAVDTAEFTGWVMDSGVEIERLALRSPEAEIATSGRLDWPAFRYRLETRAQANLEEVLPFIAPQLSIKGEANFKGLIEGDGARLGASGRASSNELIAYGVKFRDAEVDRARLDSAGPQRNAPNALNALNAWTFSAGRVRARSILWEEPERLKGPKGPKGTKRTTKGSEEIEFTTVSASNVKGTIAKGQTRITSDQATVAAIKSGQNRFNEITLHDIVAMFKSEKGSDKGDGHWTFSTAQARARSGAAAGIEFTEALASKLSATLVDGAARITSEQATISRVKSGQTEFNEVRSRELSADFESGVRDGRWTFSLGRTEAQSGAAEDIKFKTASASNVNGTISGGRAQITSGEVRIGRAEAGQGAFNEITLRDIAATIGAGAREVRGLISMQDGALNKIKFGRTSGQFTANKDEISLSGFNSVALGGGATGDLIVRLSPGGSSKLRAEFKGAQAGELFALLGARNDQLAGTVTGRVDVTWPGTNLRLISGDISARIDGQTTATPDAIPVRGEITARARDGVFYFDQFTLGTDASALSATGWLALDGDSYLRFSLISTRAEELQTLFDASGLATGELERLLKTYEPRIFGDFSFTGRLTGRLDNPTITGDARASSFGLRDEILGALSGRVMVSPSEVRFEQGELTTDAAGGGTAKFSYAAPRDATASTGRLDITFDRINLDSLLVSLGLPTQQNLVSGEVSGSARLTGLPAAPQGEVNLNLVNGLIAGQRADSATAVIRFDAQTARIERVEARLPQGRFIAGGAVNLQTREYQFQGQIEQLGLQRIAEAFELDAARLGGIIDANFQMSGNLDNPEDFKIEMTAQARQVTINGQEAGPVTLTARTSADGRIDVELTTEIAGRRQPLSASIEWRRPGRPVEIRGDLVDFDIAPFLSVFAPEIAQSITGRVTGTLRVAGPALNAQGEATLGGLRGALRLTSVSLQAQGTPIEVSTPLDIAIGDSQLRIQSARITARGTDIRVGGAIALTENAPIDFSIAGNIGLGAFDRPNDDLIMEGEVAIDARVGGSVNDPRLTGSATLRGVSASSSALPITLDEGSGRVVLTGKELTVENFTARAGAGSVRINGSVTLERFRPSEWRFDIALNDADIPWQGATATANATLTLTGTPQGQTLSGKITIPLAEYTSDFSLTELGERGRFRFGGIRAGGITTSSGVPPINLDVQLEARESFIIRNEQMNSVASASLQLTGPMDDPEVSGRITFEGGSIIFRGQRYEITSGALELSGSGEEPRLQLRVEGEIRGYRVYIGFTGPINSLDLSLSSEPALSRAEIISLITTGSAAAGTLSATDPTSAGLTTAGALLSQAFISKPLGRETERFLGLNRFQIDPVLRPYDNPAARLTIGRQLARGLSFYYSTNLDSEQEQTGAIEYDITNRFSIVTTYTQSGDTRVQGYDQNEFTIDIKGRKRFSLGAGGGGVTPPPVTGGVTPNLSRYALPPINLGINDLEGREVKISESRLRKLLPVGRQGISRAQLRLGERNLTNYLQGRGYLFAQVRGRCEPADCKATSIDRMRVIFDVSPGARYELEEIRIIGADELKESELKADLQSKEKNLLGGIPLFRNLPLLGGEARGRTSNDRMRADRETIRERLADLGYRSARVESRLACDADSDKAVLIFEVDKGPKSIIKDIIVRGNTLFPSSALLELTTVRRGDLFSPESVREGARNIRDFYTECGYLNAQAAVSVGEVSGDCAVDCVNLVYTVTEGARAVACCAEVTGNTITREGSILRFVDFRPGELLTPKMLRNAERDLYDTSAFREVIVRAEPVAGADETARRLKVNVTEADPLSLFYAVGYSTDEGPRGTIQLTNTNLFGRLILGSVRLRGSQEEQLAQVQVTDMRPWGKRWPTTFSAFYLRDSDVRPFVRRGLIDGRAEPNNRGQSFGISRFVGFIQTERKLTDLMGLRFRYSFQNVKLFNLENIPDIEVTRNEPALKLGMFSAGFTRETRNNVLLPTRGQLFSFDYSLAARQLGGNESFNKFFGEYQRYDTPRSMGGTTIAVAARLGLAGLFIITDRDGNGIISEPEKRLPISERYFAGGATTLRGFRFEQAGPQGVLEPRNPNELPTLVPIGGDALAIFNFELRYPLSRRWFLVPFYDVGNVFRRVSDLNFAGMTHSVGLGLRVNTPIGPVGVDYGYLLDPPGFVTASGATLRQPRHAFHIRIGQTF